MQQRPLVYVSRITNLSDARYCAGMGADFLGFVIDPSDPDYVSPESYQQLVGWIAGPERVVELGAAAFQEEAIREQYAPQYLHVAAGRLSDCPVSTWKLIVELPYDSLGQMGSIIQRRPDVAFVLVADLDRRVPPGLLHDLPVLAGMDPLKGPSLAHLEKTGAAGIVLQGSRETAPGLKDYDHLSQVLEELNG